MPDTSPKEKFMALLAAAVESGTLVKLTLGGPCGSDPSLRHVFVRPVTLKSGLRWSFVYRHDRRDITKNFAASVALDQVAALLETDFQTAHLSSTNRTAELDAHRDRKPRLTIRNTARAPASTQHDQTKTRLIELKDSPWLPALGVTTADGRVCAGMEAKFRQINKYVEILRHLLTDAQLTARPNLRLVDMGCGKGYLTFAAHGWLRRNGWAGAEVQGLETRRELVEMCTRVAQETAAEGLTFGCGTIESFDSAGVDVLVALHACDTATDDAIAKGIAARATLIVLAPCCHKELRPQLKAPAVLAGALRHGILLERQAEFVTDALRAALLEWAGYETRVFEFVAPEHTAKNLMIAAIQRQAPDPRDDRARQARDLAAFYGIRRQRLAEQLGFALGT